MALDTGKTLEDEFRETFKEHRVRIEGTNDRIDGHVTAVMKMLGRLEHLERKVPQLEEEIRIRTWITTLLLFVVAAILAVQIMLTQNDVHKLQNPTDTVESTKSVSP